MSPWNYFIVLSAIKSNPSAKTNDLIKICCYKQTGKSISRPTIFNALKNLQESGLVKFVYVKANKPGPASRSFTITEKGVQAYDLLVKLSEILELKL